jgi:hypothetical protein
MQQNAALTWLDGAPATVEHVLLLLVASSITCTQNETWSVLLTAMTSVTDAVSWIPHMNCLLIRPSTARRPLFRKDDPFTWHQNNHTS